MDGHPLSVSSRSSRILLELVGHPVKPCPAGGLQKDQVPWFHHFQDLRSHLLVILDAKGSLLRETLIDGSPDHLRRMVAQGHEPICSCLCDHFPCFHMSLHGLVSQFEHLPKPHNHLCALRHEGSDGFKGCPERRRV